MTLQEGEVSMWIAKHQPLLHSLSMICSAYKKLLGTSQLHSLIVLRAVNFIPVALLLNWNFTYAPQLIVIVVSQAN